jgi:hypothetical protein
MLDFAKTDATLKGIDFNLFYYADLVPRSRYYFVDVFFIDGSKLTNIKFETLEEGKDFLLAIYDYYLNKHLKNKVTFTTLAWLSGVALAFGYMLGLLL